MLLRELDVVSGVCLALVQGSLRSAQGPSLWLGGVTQCGSSLPFMCVSFTIGAIAGIVFAVLLILIILVLFIIVCSCKLIQFLHWKLVRLPHNTASTMCHSHVIFYSQNPTENTKISLIPMENTLKHKIRMVSNLTIVSSTSMCTGIL